jgi:fatty-acyl-CoA synthase
LPAILTHGGCIVLQESFEAGEALALIERERCSVYYGMGNGLCWSTRIIPGAA